MLEKYRDEVLRIISASGFELAVPNHLEFKKIGAGCVSSIFRVKLKNNSSIVVKVTEKDDLSICSGLHNREIEFYQWLSANSGEKKVHLKCPKFYGGYACNEEMGIILMEDLSSHVICNDMNFITGLNISSVFKVVKELAAIQCSYLSTSHDCKLENRFNSVYGAPMISHELPELGMSFDYSSFATHCLPKLDKIDGLLNDMRNKLREWVEPLALFKIQVAMPRDVVGVSTTLIHCDLWPENIMFGRNGEEIELLSIIDWQCFQIGNPLLDIASVLGVGMRPEDRKEYTKDVVRLYVEEMEKRKEQFKRPFGMTIEKAHRLLSLSFRYACVQLMTAIVTLSDEEVQENPVEYDTMVVRLLQLMEDAMSSE